jgi:uncharacterized protein (TIGR00255 family)
MIRSMTGFGEARAPIPEGELRVTIKTVNHRFFNANLRTPTGFDGLELSIQQWLKKFFFRGHVSYTLALERDQGKRGNGFPELDLERARHYRDLLEELAGAMELDLAMGLQDLLRFNDIFRLPDAGSRVPELDPELVQALTEEAAQKASEMREQEGARLEMDLRVRLAAMGQELDAIEARAPKRLLEERDRLHAAIRELAQSEEVDEDRLAREVAYLAERWDINEEVVRFQAHLQAFRDTLDSDGTEPVGKRLGFLVQEMHREANTIGSKANDVEMSHASVTIREEIERLREQLENVE